MQHPAPVTATATFCATLVDQWLIHGVSNAFIAPGSRSTPLALALASRPEMTIHVFHDERSASFAALGSSQTHGQPAIVLSTSGTATAHFHAAVIEADLACIPLLVCTADRPPELWDVGAPQTINQTELYGQTVRAFHQPGPPEDGHPAQSDPAPTAPTQANPTQTAPILNGPTGWRTLAAESYREAIGQRPGPVHLNLSFRDPLVGEAGELPPPLTGTVAEMPTPGQPTASETAVSHFAASQLVAACLDTDGAPKRGAIIAGRGPSSPQAVVEFAARLGWPILADHRSGCRTPEQSIRHFDGLLRSAHFAKEHQPEVILRLGEILSSKAVSQWITNSNTPVIAAMPWGRRIDPEAVDPLYLPQENLVEAAVEADLPNNTNSEWLRSWREADAAANRVIIKAISEHDGTAEPAVARAVLRDLPENAALVVSSSMPVRDLEWFGENRDDIKVYANRGANGIDGVTSTSVGIALTGTPTVCLIGDIAFLHDSGALIGLTNRDLDLTIVVTDNDGGGIFSFLPQQSFLEPDRYEQLFGTSHGTDLQALVAAHGLRVEDWEASPADIPLLRTGQGVRVILAKTDRESNRQLHNRIVDAIDSAVAIDSAIA